jgi:hypothetical protein
MFHGSSFLVMALFFWSWLCFSGHVSGIQIDEWIVLTTCSPKLTLIYTATEEGICVLKGACLLLEMERHWLRGIFGLQFFVLWAPFAWSRYC